MSIKRAAFTVLCALLIAANIATCAFANWYDDVKSGGTWIKIEGEGFVADTFCGVDALYNENDYYYQCNDLVMRFYKEAYGLDILAYSNTGPVMLTDGYAFVDAETPKKGDIIYVTAEMRGSATDHWAIVKDYGNGYITMFEQNAVWDGKAARNRQIKYPSDSYYLLTPVSLGDAPAPVLRGYEEQTTDARPTTTAKPETTVAPATTAEPTTTTKPTTAKPTTAKPETTKATTVKSTTEKYTTTNPVTTVTETAAATTAASEIFEVTQTEEVTTQAVIAENTEESAKESVIIYDGKGPVFILPLVFAGAVLVAVIAVTVVIIKKKK